MRGLRGAMTTLLLAAAVLAGCAEPADPAGDGPDFDELGLAATSSTGVIRGIVVDDAIRPIGNVTLTLSPGGRTATSSADGLFGFQGLEPGLYFIAAARPGYNATQSSTEVVAGVAEPAIVKLLMSANPSATPYVEVSSYEGFMTCGVAVFATSVGCATSTAEQFGDIVYFLHVFTTLPNWTQGELVWEQTQAFGGGFIWQIAKPGTNDYYSAGQTGSSPLLAYIDTATLDENREAILETGVEYRVFGGPNPNCTVDVAGVTPYGCGLTLQQRFTAYVHSFFHFLPQTDWRFTVDGPPVVPPQ